MLIKEGNIVAFRILRGPPGEETEGIRIGKVLNSDDPSYLTITCHSIMHRLDTVGRIGRNTVIGVLS